MNTLIIEDLAFDDTTAAGARVRSLSSEEMKRVCGGPLIPASRFVSDDES